MDSTPELSRAPHGCVMDIADATALLSWADADGFLKLPFEVLPKQFSEPSGNYATYKSRVLSNALIHGGIDLLLPVEAHDIAIRNLRDSLGLDVAVDYPIGLGDVQLVDNVCSRLRHIADELEANERFSGIWLLDHNVTNDSEIHASAASHLTVGEQVDDYNYYLNEFRNLLLIVDDFAPDLFQKFHSSQRAVVDLLEDMSVDAPAMHEAIWGESDDPSDEWPNINARFLVEHMNLWPRRGAAALEAREREPAAMPFPTFALGDMFDTMVSWRERGFSDSAMLGMLLGGSGTPYADRILGFWLSWLQFRQLLRISNERSSVMCFAADSGKAYELSKHEDRLQLFQVFIKEVNAIPKVDSFGDLVRLYHDPHVHQFRQQLSHWRTVVREGNVAAIKRMRRDFDLAMTDLAKSVTLQRVGGVVSVVALPVAIGGLLSGLPLDFAFTAVGPAINAQANRLARRSAWARFGSPYARI